MPESPEPEAIKLVGRWSEISTLLPAGQSTVGPTVITQDQAGTQRIGFLLASHYDKTLRHVLIITCEPVPRLGPEPEMMLLLGGFDVREIMDDTTKNAGFLTFLYPASDSEELKKRLGTTDK
jgi:hypothetical protein